MGRLMQDVRFFWRTLRRTPAFPLSAIATLAIGIGATTAIFSTVNAALLKPLPYPNSGDLYALRTALTDGRVTTGNLSPVEILGLNDPNLSIERAAALLANDVTLLRDDDTPIKTRAYVISEGFFELFGLPLSLGTVPPPPPPNSPPMSAVISHRVWQDMFGGAPDVIGRPVRFAEVSVTVGAVAAREFDTPPGADFWIPIALNPTGVNHSFEGFMRVKPGTTQAQVESQMGGVLASIARDYPISVENRVFVVRPLVASIVGDLGPILLVVLTATAVLLLLACVNVTNLLLARGAARSREMAVRVALGAGRWSIVRQLLTESLLLATVGAVIGVFAAWSFVRVLLTMGASQLPRLESVSFDGRVLLFAVVTLIVSGVLVGFAPALRLAATDVRTLMNESTRSASGGRGTMLWLGGLTVAEVALAVTLVAGAGWLVRSFDSLQRVDPGFMSDGRLTFDVGFFGPDFSPNTKVHAAYMALFDSLRRIPGVAGVGATFNLPLRQGPENAVMIRPVGDPVDVRHNSRQRLVSPGFFSAMGVRLLAGREFTEHDRGDSLPVAIVNRSFADRYLATRDPLVVRFHAGYPEINPKIEWSIVGVVEDVRQRTLSAPPEPAYYTTYQPGTPPPQTVVVHTTAGDSPSLRETIRAEARKLNPLMVVEIERLSDVVRATLTRQQLGMMLMLVFGAAAVALAAVGVYGVIAYTAAQRQGEMAIRLALGATGRDVFRLVLTQGRRMALLGATLGVIAAYTAGRVVSSQLYDVRASDPLILGFSTLLVVAIALVAIVIPAIRASRIDPARVLRLE
jgi:putative ABC transport system permease protein